MRKLTSAAFFPSGSWSNFISPLGNAFIKVPVLTAKMPRAMKASIRKVILLPFMLVVLTACDETFEDAIPKTYFMIQTNPDDIYMYNGPSARVRLDPLLNDSVKVEVSISYSTPLFGSIEFIPDEGWFYTPNEGFYGIDNIKYTLCYDDGCASASITMWVEEPPGEVCIYSIEGENIETEKDQPIEIRVYLNDNVCPYMGGGMSGPEKGTFNTYAYSGSFKNIVYVYYPPRGYTGTDRFRYKLYTPGGEIEAWCNITIK